MTSLIKHYRKILGISCTLISIPAMAESNLQIGLVTSVNNSLYKNAGMETYLFPLVIAEYDRFYLQGTHGGYRLIETESGQSAYSRPSLPPIPDESCHPFHAKPATDSTAKLPPVQRA